MLGQLEPYRSKPVCPAGRAVGGNLAHENSPLNPISAEIHGRRSVAVTITAGLVLAGISDIVDAGGTHEIELRAADIDIFAILDQ